MSTSREFDRTLGKINRIKPGQMKALPWLVAQLHNDNAALRCAAISAIDRSFDSADQEANFLSMLDSEVDQDVILRLMSVLSSQHQGSRDPSLARRFIRAVARFEPQLSGTRDSLDDALLRLMDNLNSAAIFKLSSEERAKRIAEIREELGEQERVNEK